MTSSDEIRRVCRRYTLAPMYTAVTARRGRASDIPGLCGHIYDISERGIRIELDEALDPGESVVLELDLPGAALNVQASASVVWVHDANDDPGPRRMALEFTAFPNRTDRNRLFEFLGREHDRHAAA